MNQNTDNQLSSDDEYDNDYTMNDYLQKGLSDEVKMQYKRETYEHAKNFLHEHYKRGYITKEMLKNLLKRLDTSMEVKNMQLLTFDLMQYFRQYLLSNAFDSEEGW